MNKIIGWAVYSIPTKDAKIFCNATPQRETPVYKTNEEAHAELSVFQYAGRLTELISHYDVLPVYEGE